MARKKTYGEKIADHIAAVVQARNIEHVLHFTLLENLPGILRNGLLSRAILQDADYDVFASDVDRLDGEDGAISVSISCFYPNFHSPSCKRASEVASSCGAPDSSTMQAASSRTEVTAMAVTERRSIMAS